MAAGARGEVTDYGWHRHAVGNGYLYDAKRKLVYVFTFRGEAWGLRIDPAAARLVEKPPRPRLPGMNAGLGSAGARSLQDQEGVFPTVGR